MPGFQLTQGGTTYSFDLQGGVQVNAAAFGTWTVDASNQIAVTGSDGTHVSIPVVWQFNSNNQLCLSAGGAQVFNFNSTTGIRPFYATRDAVLQVRPDRNNIFGFNLLGTWDFDQTNHELSFTINGTKSPLDGFVSDTRSRFMYFFSDKQDPTIRSILGFVGTWGQDPNDQLLLDFTYQVAGGTPGVFKLPKTLTIDTSSNQLVYRYDKNGHTHEIQFVGFLTLSDDLQISYSLDQQFSQTGAVQLGSTNLVIDTHFSSRNGDGDLELSVQKTAQATTISIGGGFTAVLGDTNLQVGFGFSQTRAGSQVTTTVGFSGNLSWNSGKSSVEWQFSGSSSGIALTLSATDIVLGDARIDFRLNLQTTNGQIAGVTFMLGINF
jgi:hypothetical protein